MVLVELRTMESSSRITNRGVTEGLRPRLGHARLMRMLGLSAAGADPVTIITAAQVRLRRWRRTGATRCPQPRLASDHIRQITEARDVLLREALRVSGGPLMRRSE
jgi:hypothetical protein